MILSKSKAIEFIICILITALALTNLEAFKIVGLSFSVYIVLGLPLIILISLLKFSIPNFQNKYAFLILIYIIISSILNFSSFRATSVIYSFLFLLYYLYINSYSKQYLSHKKLKTTLQFIFISYFVVLLIAQFLVLFDLYNLDEQIKGYFQQKGKFGIEFNVKAETFRYFSLSSEPSYASIIVIMCFSCLVELKMRTKEFYIYGILLLYMLLSFGSAIGIICLIAWIFSQIKLSQKHYIISGLFILVALMLFFFTQLGGKSVDRIREIVFLIFSNSGSFLENLNKVDSSAHARIGPFFSYVEQMSFLDYRTYFGHGASSSEAFFSKIIYPEAWNKNMVFRPAFIPGFLYDYGFLGCLIVISFLHKLLEKSKSVFYKIIIVIVLFNSNLNTQLFWFIIVLIALINWFRIKTLNIQY